MTKKKLLFITTRLFWPTDSGRKLSLYYYCKGLHEKYNCDIYLYSFLEAGQSITDLEEKPSFIKHVKLAQPISYKEKIKNLLFKTFMRRQWPLQCSLYYSEENERKIKDHCSQINPDYIFTDMIRTAMYYDAFEQSSALKVLDMDDLLSARYKRQLQSPYTSNISGQYTNKLPMGIRTLIGNRFIKKLVLTVEWQLTQKAEVFYANLYDRVIFVSQVETDYLNRILPEKAITIPVGINLFNDERLSIKAEKNILSFVGNLNVAANVDSLRWIIEDILPKIHHDVKLLVIGKCPSHILEQYKDNNKLIFSGRVDDLVAYVRKGQIFLSPLLYGTGIKTKILEAMAMGVPVVTNDVGAEGINAQHKEAFWIENSPEEIAVRIDDLLDHYDKALAVARNAKKVVEVNYEWNKIWGKFADILS